jgi:hypothetical protein
MGRRERALRGKEDTVGGRQVFVEERRPDVHREVAGMADLARDLLRPPE